MIYRIGDQSPDIHPSVFVAQSADVMGQVTLREHSSVWFNAVIRGDCDHIEVGARSNIQDGAVLHCDPGKPLVIGEDVTVGHNAMIHCLEVGDRTLVGINAVILDGAKIGSDCIIGANTLVKANAVIPDGSWWWVRRVLLCASWMSRANSSCLVRPLSMLKKPPKWRLILLK